MSQRTRLTRAKITILGDHHVGKTAFAVRYLTKRFIGEYDENKEMLYSQRVHVDRDDINLDILDTANDTVEALSTLESHITWADGFILVYSVTDKESYKRLQYFYDMMTSLRKADVCTPIVIIANKVDLTYSRKVTETEGCEVGKKYNYSPVYEISVAESSNGVMDAMEEILRQIKRESVRTMTNAGIKKESTFNSVKRAFKKISRSKSDTV